MSRPFEQGEKVTSSLFDGEGEVVSAEYERGITIVSVRVPGDTVAIVRGGVARYDSRDLRRQS